VAAIFDEIADLLELAEASPSRAWAYRSAARRGGNLSRDIAAMINERSDPTELPGFGEKTEQKIVQAIATWTGDPGRPKSGCGALTSDDRPRYAIK
jgi:DNA polymerase (family 10)